MVILVFVAAATITLVLILAAAVAIVLRRDAFYDRAAGTRVMEVAGTA